MNEKERMKKLLAECINEPEKTCPMPEETTCDGRKHDLADGGCDILGRYADHMLANGAILPPCKMGDVVYLIECCTTHPQPFEVSRIQYTKDYGLEIGAYSRNQTYRVFHETDFGKTVFLTKEEAEQVLKERES